MELLETIRTKVKFYLKLAGREDTPLVSKVMLILAVVYLLSPIDLIPDFIPVIGFLDDLIIVPSLIWLALKLMKETAEQSDQTEKDETQRLKNK